MMIISGNVKLTGPNIKIWGLLNFWLGVIKEGFKKMERTVRIHEKKKKN